MGQRPDIEAIEAREQAATPGPWESSDPRGRAHGYVFGLWSGYDGEVTIGDAVFIAHARTDVPALIAYARELEGVLRDLTEAAERYDVAIEQAPVYRALALLEQVPR
jgi:hypothetical protein